MPLLTDIFLQANTDALKQGDDAAAVARDVVDQDAGASDDVDDAVSSGEWIDTTHFTLEAPDTLNPYLSSQVMMVLSLIQHLEYEGVPPEDIQRAWDAGGRDNHYEALIVLRELAQKYPEIAEQFENGINQHFGLPEIANCPEFGVPRPEVRVGDKPEFTANLSVLRFG